MKTRLATLGSLAAIAVVAASSLLLAGNRKRPTKSEDVTVTGTLVDLQSYMTGKPGAGDPKRTAQQAIRSGVPAALETEDGLIVVGMGDQGPGRLLIPLVLQQVELKGKLYEKEGLHYIDITSAEIVKEEEPEEEQSEHPEPAAREEEEQPEEEAAEDEP